MSASPTSVGETDSGRYGVAVELGRRHIGIILVLTAFAVGAIVVPTLAPLAVSDDWIYSRAVQRLVEDHVLRVPDLATSTLVGQVLWGAAFAKVFGFSLGVMRVSTLVVTAVGAVALYGLCTEMGATRRMAALGAGIHLFNPLSLALAYSFMTDAHFTAWVIVALYWYVRGLRRASGLAVLAGSAAASMAFLVRQQGALLPVCVAIYLTVAHWRRWGLVIRRATQAAWLPLLVAIVYLVWVTQVNGVPVTQNLFIEDIRRGGVAGLLQLLWRVPFIAVMTIGLLVGPIVIALRRPTDGFASPRWRPDAVAFSGACLLVISCFAVFFIEGREFPYAGQFFSSSGIGPTDLLGMRERLWGDVVGLTITGLALIGGVAWMVFSARAVRRWLGPRVRGAAVAPPLLVVIVLIGQALGALLPSFHFLFVGQPVFTLDRYLLPLLPLAIAVLAAVVPASRLRFPLAWAGVAVVGILSLAGTRDFITEQSVVWSTADALHRVGVPKTKIDAGPGWDGWHLSDGTFFEHPSRTLQAPWWVAWYAPATDSTYAVTFIQRPRPGLALHRIEWRAWLRPGPSYLYLHYRPPPVPETSTDLARLAAVRRLALHF